MATALGLGFVLSSPLTCNALFGVDELSYHESSLATGGQGGSAGAGGDGGSEVDGPTVAWLLRFGHSGTHAVMGLAASAASDVAVAGWSNGPISLGPGALTEGGGDDIVVFQLDRAGQHQWSARFGQAGNQWANDVAFHDQDHVLLAGHYTGNVDFGESSFAAGAAIHGFSARLGGLGSEVWAAQYSGPVASTTAVARTVAGSTLVGGDFSGVTWFDATVSHAAVADKDGFVAAHGQDGELLWVTPLTGPHDEKTLDVTTGQLGRVVAAGYFDESLSVAGWSEAVPAEGARDAFVVWLNVDGSPHAAYGFGGDGHAMARGVASRQDGEVVVVGQFDDRIRLGTDDFASQGGQDLFVMKLTSEGQVLWARAYGGSNDESPGAVALAEDGSVWIAGTSASDLDLGGGVLPHQGAVDVIVFALDRDGGPLFSLRGGDELSQQATAIAVQGDDIFVGGHFGGTLTFGEHSVSAEGTANMFVLRLDRAP